MINPTLTICSIISISADKTASDIVNHRETQEMVLQDHKDKEVEKELLNFVSLQFCAFNLSGLISQVQIMNMLVVIKIPLPIHSKYLHVGYHLLQAASLLPELPIKLCSLIPQGIHLIVHATLSGMIALYRFFKKAHARNLVVPFSFIHNSVFVPQKLKRTRYYKRLIKTSTTGLKVFILSTKILCGY
ncbi:hypothetical protein EDC96DRAFT_169505 [Choanephora cucurbitarum]|nr:hypothetical protein EDC96DRAFT_169505 [Choanephora cucurbitarum]